MKKYLAVLLTFTGFSLHAQTAKMFNPVTVHQPKGGYSHATVIDLGTSKMVITAGQIALDKEGIMVGKRDFAKQAEQVYLNIRNIMEAEGGTMEHIVKTGTYVLDMSNIKLLRPVRAKFFSQSTPPASTLLEVGELFMPDALIEIEVIAIIPK